MALEKLPSDWRQSTLGEVADPNSKAIVSGPFGSNIGSRFFVEQGVPVIRGNNLTTDLTRFIDNGFVFITTAKADELGNCEAAADDLIFTAAGSLGQVGIIPRAAKYTRYIISNKQLRARVDSNQVDPLFAFYWFSSREMVEYVQRRNTGSSVPLINLSVLRSLPLPLPPLAEQRAIAHILGTMDDKIELNRQMNEILEAMARALFKSWFVEFEPVRAKAEGRDLGLPKHLADLFPDSFEESELGSIPQGWEVTSLAQCVDVTRGLSYKGSDLSENGVPMHNLNSIYEGGGYKRGGVKYYKGEYRPQHVTRPGDLIVANTEQGHDRLLIGYGAIVPRQFEGETIFSHHVYRVNPKRASGLTTFYLCHLLNTRAMHNIVSGYANGTTVNMLPVDGLQSPQIVRPPLALVRVFNEFAEATLKRRDQMADEDQCLLALRDSLLPKLISGELRVKDAERFLTDRGL